MSTDPLATLDDLAEVIKSGISDDDSDWAERLLIDASARVRAYTGQNISTETYTDKLIRVDGLRVTLPQRPVTAVTAVTDIADAALDYTWDGFQTVYLAAPVVSTIEVPAVKVTYTAGWDPVPDIIVTVVCAVAGRAYGRSVEAQQIIQETIGDYSVGYGSQATTGADPLTAADRQVLDGFASPRVGTVRLRTFTETSPWTGV